MASGEEMDQLCCEFFQLSVQKEQAKKLEPGVKYRGKGTAVRKILKDAMGESSATISCCEASIFPKYQDKAKTVSEDDFVKKILPELAAMKTKSKGGSPKADEELAKMKKKICGELEKAKNPKGTKQASVVSRLTDTSKYTGSHKERFDESGQGKGMCGRKEQVDDSGYVGNYKGAGTFDEKK